MNWSSPATPLLVSMLVSSAFLISAAFRALTGGLPLSASCDFDSSLCSFIQDPQDDMDWTVHRGKTVTFATGPDCDPIDCTSGRYLYIESSRPARNGDRAKLRTPTLGGEGHRCLTFFYHMYGSDIGELTVSMTNVLTGQSDILWVCSGNQGNNWTMAYVNFLALDAFDVSFEATVGVYKGDIAIDSISVDVGRCSGAKFFNCTFQHGMCGWTNAGDPVDTLDWLRQAGETDTPNTGPVNDRFNAAGGYYIFVESSRTRPGDAARLVSPEMLASTSGSYCLTFWYHMHGRTTGNLTVIYQTEVGSEEDLWSVQGDQENQWHFQNVNVPHRTTHTFNIVFEATVAGFYSDIAIDDISLLNASCSS